MRRRKRVREHDWDARQDEAFSHDRAKHIKGGKTTEAEAAAEVASHDVAPNAIVVTATGSWAFAHYLGGEVLCRVDESLMVGRSSVLAPGDRVRLEQREDQLFVAGLAPRVTRLSRPATRQSRVTEQVIAANVDVLLIVASAAEPAFKAGLVDRYLVAADVGGVKPVLCVNKMDLVKAEPRPLAEYRELGLDVICTSCETGQGIEELRQHLRDALTVLAGQSGVGKSTILNAIEPGLDLDTREVSRFNEKGKHTTSAARLYELGGGIRVIDTPGIRKLGVWGVSHEELVFYFPEFDNYATGCRFRNCTHIHEPACAVRQAVEDGVIPRRRFGSYRRIRESLQPKT